MCAKIMHAFPTEASAIQHLKKMLTQADKAISPITAYAARSMYPEHISDQFHFQCPSAGCTAPVTCRSLSSQSKYKPTFVNQSVKIDLHKDGCPYSPKFENPSSAVNKKSTPKDTFEFKGKLESHLHPVLFQPPTPAATSTTTQTNDLSGTSITDGKYVRHTSTPGDRKRTKEITHHLRSMQDHVDCFTANKNSLVRNAFFSRPQPIRNFFSHVCQNEFDSALDDIPFLKIAFGSARINELPNRPELLRITFSESVRLNNHTNTRLYPSFLISRTFLENEFPDILQYIDEGRPSLRAFIRAPFILNAIDDKAYLNFDITPEALLYNVHFYAYQP
ncbi:hypothetical protein HCA63_17015 [Listeria booriae]|uniref:hypothetical protein n=1 Tax=Listeria booriae TaxID=1552123 RepID=UPI00162421D2|nr:hypothetical protein [Listeria booriae]MBC1890060.1 hypothetical protein [Listeria booriae]